MSSCDRRLKVAAKVKKAASIWGAYQIIMLSLTGVGQLELVLSDFHAIVSAATSIVFSLATICEPLYGSLLVFHLRTGERLVDSIS